MARPSTDQGFSLLEVVVALAIFGIILMSLPAAFVTQIKFNTLTEHRIGAMAAAHRKLDTLRALDPGEIASSGMTEETITIDERPYSVITTYCEDASLCNLTSRQITVEVALNDRRLFDVETFYTRLR